MWMKPLPVEAMVLWSELGVVVVGLRLRNSSLPELMRASAM